MPLVRIDLVQGKSAEYRRAIGGVVYEAMVDALKAPKDDRFQVIAEYPADALKADENYLGIRRTQDCVLRERDRMRSSGTIGGAHDLA